MANPDSSTQSQEQDLCSDELLLKIAEIVGQRRPPASNTHAVNACSRRPTPSAALHFRNHE
jgi:hypothetical protein